MLYKKDQKGKYRSITSVQAAKNNGISDMGDFLEGELLSGLSELCKTPEEELMEESKKIRQNELYPMGFIPYNDVWRYEPVESSYFARKFLGEAFTAKQQETVDIICGKDPFSFTDIDFEEVDAMWGKRSGKDSTLAKAGVIQGYKLCCMMNPNEFLGMGIGGSIDIVNVASSSEQAKNIFFKYLTNFVKMAKDPDTGRNWFATRNFWWDVGKQDFIYMDLRDGEGNIKQKQIDFGRGICCHSLTSDRFTAEGLNIILAFMDEIGAMRPDRVFGAGEGDKVIGQYDSLLATTRATSTTGMGKLVCMSYKYGRNCPMTILTKRNKGKKGKFVRVYSVYEVRTDKKEEDLRRSFQSQYDKDPEKAAMMYECKDPSVDSNNLYSNIFLVKNCYDESKKFTVNPFRGNRIVVDNIYDDMDNLLEPWFRGNKDYFYTLHLDLAKGQVWKGHDAAGIALGHIEEMRLSFDRSVIEYFKRKYNRDLSEIEGQLRYGIVIDLVAQIVCKKEDKEVNLKDVREFAINLQEKRDFQLIKATVDGWQSVETLQDFERRNIEAELLSVDRTPAAHHTQKDFVQMGLFKTYEHPIWYRETIELIEDDKTSKIDHPELSNSRFEQEGFTHGSKDVTDCTAGVSFTLSKEIDDGGDIII